MRISKAERIQAEQVSIAIDMLLSDPDAQQEIPADEAGVLGTARQLARIPFLLGAADPALEQRVMRLVHAGAGRTRRVPRFKPGWVVAGVVTVLLVVMSLTPLGKTAVASFMAVFNLGQTEVHITPANTPSGPSGTAIKQDLTLEQAQAQVTFDIPQPEYLPPGYGLRRIIGYTYPDLPAWVPQPFFLDFVYGDDSGRECTLRLYPITLGDRASISRMNLEAAPIQDVEDVQVGDQPGVLLSLGSKEVATAWQEVVWEQNDLILALSAPDLTRAELLQIARSVR